MRVGLKLGIVAAALAAALGGTAPAALAQVEVGVEAETGVIDQAASTEPTRAAQRMAADFATFVGTEDDALALVEGLRSGSAVTFAGETQDVTITPGAPMGYGNVFATLALAQQSLAQIGIADPSHAELAAALSGGTIVVDGVDHELEGILALRAAGMGWGEIAQAQGVKLGPVISALRSGKARLATAAEARPAQAQARGRAEAAEKAARSGGVDGVELLIKAERPEKAQRPEKVERPERPEKPERPERPERPEKPERAERR